MEINRGTVETDDANKVGRIARVTKHRVNIGVASVKANQFTRGFVLRVVDQGLGCVMAHKTIHATKSTPVAAPDEITRVATFKSVCVGAPVAPPPRLGSNFSKDLLVGSSTSTMRFFLNE